MWLPIDFQNICIKFNKNTTMWWHVDSIIAVQIIRGNENRTPF